MRDQSEGVKRQTRDGLRLGALLAVLGTPLMGLEMENVPGAILLDGRIRLETADQEGLDGSTAVTARLRFGYELGLSEGFGFRAEGEGTAALNSGDYDAYPGGQGTPGKTVIADPQNLELNRLQVSWKGEGVTVIGGRQRIIRNNARFIGNVGWRQNEQTFDAAGIDFKPTEKVSLYYAYLDRAQRIFGDRATDPVQREFKMESHVLEGQYAPSEAITAGAYAYLLGIRNSAGASSDTYGAWIAGKSPVNDELALDWRAELARQSDNSKSPAGADFDLSYYHRCAGLEKAGLGTVGGGFEILEGDAHRGFSTPLATLHAFNGFADVFLSTPANGLEDYYLKAAFPVTKTLKATAVFHEFRSENSSGRIGRELDLVLGYKISQNLSATAKAAFYDGSTNADVTKFWLQLDAKY